MKRYSKKHNVVYQITNLVNGKVYIGAHATNDLADGYMGSGVLIQKAIDKYGNVNFKKEILFEFTNVEDMYAKERELVDSCFIKRLDTYNVVLGGWGGGGVKNRGPKGKKHLYHPLTGERVCVESSAVQKLLDEGWTLGSKHGSRSGTIWIHKGDEKRGVTSEQLGQYLAEGWQKGLPSSPTKGKIWIYHAPSDQYSLCDLAQLDEKLSTGWVKRKWSPLAADSTWINDGAANRRVSRQEALRLVGSGWFAGKFRHK